MEVLQYIIEAITYSSPLVGPKHLKKKKKITKDYLPKKKKQSKKMPFPVQNALF